jgi:hypothetical protein
MCLSTFATIAGVIFRLRRVLPFCSLRVAHRQLPGWY